MWGWFWKRAVQQGVEQGVREAIDEATAPGGAIDRVIHEVLREPQYRWFWFVKAMQARMMEVDPKMDGKVAFHTAARAYRDFLREERIRFGDPAYDWTAAGARDLIQAVEIDYWETAA